MRASARTNCQSSSIAAWIAFSKDAVPDFVFLLGRHEHPFGHLGNGAAAATAYIVESGGAYGYAGRVGSFGLIWHLGKKQPGVGSPAGLQ